jgi:hypothetical protein
MDGRGGELMRLLLCASAVAILSAGAAASTASAQGPWEDRVRAGVNVGVQPSSTTFAGSTEKTVYLEDAVLDTTYGVGSGRSFDAGVLFRVAGSFGLGIAVSSFAQEEGGAVSATIPHPFFFNARRSIAGTSAGLERRELVTHLHAAYVFTAGRRLDVAISGGPSFFKIEQGLVSDVTFAESYPYDTAAFSSASIETVSSTKVGFNAGVDVGVRLARQIGVGALVRFSRISVEFPLAGASAPVESDAGGVQVAGGVRLFF